MSSWSGNRQSSEHPATFGSRSYGVAWQLWNVQKKGMAFYFPHAIPHRDVQRSISFLPASWGSCSTGLACALHHCSFACSLQITLTDQYQVTLYKYLHTSRYHAHTVYTWCACRVSAHPSTASQKEKHTHALWRQSARLSDPCTQFPFGIER